MKYIVCKRLEVWNRSGVTCSEGKKQRKWLLSVRELLPPEGDEHDVIKEAPRQPAVAAVLNEPCLLHCKIMTVVPKSTSGTKGLE